MTNIKRAAAGLSGVVCKKAGIGQLVANALSIAMTEGGDAR
jgi:hypothetical protein